jgi:hypothetical protein
MVAVNDASMRDRAIGSGGIADSLLGASGAIGSGGDQYVGLDRFGRVVDQNWVNAAGTTVDGYTYSYDGDSNVTARNNTLDSAYSQGYSYDSLNRLTAATQDGSAYQSWNLDSQGNWSSFTSGTTTQTESANAQNQITSISGSATPTYDANGNMISDQNGNTYVFGKRPTKCIWRGFLGRVDSDLSIGFSGADRCTRGSFRASPRRVIFPGVIEMLGPRCGRDQ